jgi:hypothetical protein
MRVSGHRHPPLGKRGVKELSMTPLLTAKHPSLVLKSLQNLPNFHEPILPLAVFVVNAQNDPPVFSVSKSFPAHKDDAKQVLPDRSASSNELDVGRAFRYNPPRWAI